MDNVAYIERLYRDWQKDPAAVESAWDAHFRGASQTNGEVLPAQGQAPSQTMAYKQSRVDSLLWAYRDVGYIYARLNPLGGDYGPRHEYLRRHETGGTYEALTPEAFGLSADDLDTVFSAGRAMKQADIILDHIDLFEYHDAFSIYAALSLEAVGFAIRGQGWKLAAEGQIALNGRIPCATMGGLKARGFPGGATGVYQAVEAATQLRGQAEANQVPNAKVAIIQSLGGPAPTAVTHVLETLN